MRGRKKQQRSVWYNRPLPIAISIILGICFLISVRDGTSTGKINQILSGHKEITRFQLRSVIEKQAPDLSKFPNEVDLDHERVIVQYSFDPGLQEAMERALKTHRPDYGAFVALDAQTGRVLAMVSYADGSDHAGNLALKATFPSASVFKVVTAAAVIAEKNFSAQTVIPFHGSNHTLFKRNISQTEPTRWTRYMTLKEAFAKSVNPAFGKLGAHTLGASKLEEYAGHFGFNRRIKSEIPFQEGRAMITNETFALAESGSGFTRDTTMSPLQGALIGAAIANHGNMMEPYIIESVHTTTGNLLYKVQPKLAQKSVSSQTAEEIKVLMRETVTHGTARQSFKRFFRGEHENLDVGGKTGSLTGMDPPGKYDWFVGYASDGKRQLAFASLAIHAKQWRVKSAQLARIAIEAYFRDIPHQTETADSRGASATF